MEILQLRYFYESAKNENFSQTAKIFQVPATSVSASIKRLENELGCKLFDRVSNKIFLNNNGKNFFKAVSDIFSQLDSAVNEISSNQRDTRQIKLLIRGMRRNVTSLISRFNEHEPHITFKIVFDFEKNNSDEFDVIIDEEKDIYSDFQHFPLFSTALCLKCAATSSLKKEELSLSQLKNQRFIVMDLKGNMYRILKNACNGAGFEPEISAICNDIECYENLISTDMGIGIGRSHSPLLKNLNVTDFNENYVVYAYFRKDAYYGNVKKFVDFLKSSADLSSNKRR